MNAIRHPTGNNSMKDSFSLALSRAPTKVGNALRKLGISDWSSVRSLDPETILKLGGFGRKTCEDFKQWRESCLDEQNSPRTIDSPSGISDGGASIPRCRDYHSYREWVRAVFDLLFTKPSRGRETVLEHRLAVLDEQESLTLQETGALANLTRQRIQTIEAETKRQIVAGSHFFRDLVTTFDAVVSQSGYVLGRDTFLGAFSQQIGWDVADCLPQLIRLLSILGCKVEWFPKEPLSDARFVVSDFDANGKARYDRFLDLLETEATTTEAVQFTAVRNRLSNSGVPDLSETEYAFFAEKAMSERRNTPGFNCLRLLRGKAGRRVSVRAALLDILSPAGIQGLTSEEIDNRLRERLGSGSPTFRSCPKNDLDGEGTSIWISDQGGGRDNVTRYALSSFCPEIPNWLVEQLENELAEHLRANHCDAALLSRFYDQWKASKKIPADIPERFLLETLKLKTKGIVVYPNCHSSPAFALPNADLGAKTTGLFLREASLYFKGRRLVPEDEVLRFATEVFGYHGDWQARNECSRLFSKEGNAFIVNPCAIS